MIDDIRSALFFIPAHDTDTWLKIALILKSEFAEDGFSLFDDWSATAGNYNKLAVMSTWRHTRPSGKLTHRTLFSEAIKYGWKPSKPYEPPTTEQLAEIERQREASIAAFEAEKAERHKQAQERADIIYSAASECVSHPYLDKKQIKPFGDVRVGRWTAVNDDGEIWMDVQNTLIIPIKSGSKIVSVQAIFPDANNPLKRDKTYLSGGKKRGGFFSIKSPGNTDNDQVIAICEGYATGCSIAMATDFAVIAAFDAGNLTEVAKKIRAKYKKARILVCADNDQFTDGNPGITKARQAAQEVNGIVVFPPFCANDAGLTDFNDLHCRDGLSAVSAVINAALNPKYDIIEAKNTSTAVAALESYSLAQFPDLNGNGKPLSTISNMHCVCRALNVNVRYNVIKKETEILIPGQGFSCDNESNASLAWLISECVRMNMPIGQINDYLCYIADKNPYNPVAEWVTSKPWDGETRIPQLLSTIKADGEEDDESIGRLKESMIKKWMLSAIGAAFSPTGISSPGILVIQGAQYLGKTAWFKSLVPKDMNLIQDGLILKPDDRDSVKQAVSYWMVELGELDATFRKSDIAQLKAFITRDKDVLRLAYAKRESQYARRTVFFASVNPRQYLHDPTGNRRYWTISATEIDHCHGIDMQQVWAEIYETMYLKGESWYLDSDDMATLNAHNKDFEIIDPIRENILSTYDWKAPKDSWGWKQVTDVLKDIGLDRPTRADTTSCGIFLSELNDRSKKRSNGKNLTLVAPKVVRIHDY